MLLLAPRLALAAVLLADILEHVALALAACPAAAARCRRRCCCCRGMMISAARGDTAAAAISAGRISIALRADPLRHGDLRRERSASTTCRVGVCATCPETRFACEAARAERRCSRISERPSPAGRGAVVVRWLIELFQNVLPPLRPRAQIFSLRATSPSETQTSTKG